MARVIRRHWRLMLLQFMLLIGGIGLLAHRLLKSPARAEAVAVGNAPNAPPAAAPTPANVTAPVNVSGYMRVRQLRQKFALQSADLAAMGCSQTLASQILSTLSTWVTTNASTWTQLQKSLRTAQNTLAAAIRQINMGTSDQNALTSVPTLQQNVSAAQQQMDQFMQGAANAVSALLSSSQQQIWAAACSNVAAKVPSRYRYVQGLTADQAKALVLATYRGQDGTALLPAKAAQIQAAKQNLTQNVAGVVAAETAVLPMPSQLRPRAASATQRPTAPP